MIETLPLLRIASEQPAPLALSDYEPFTCLGRGAYGVSEILRAPVARHQAALQAVRRLFKLCRSVGVSKVERVRAVFFDMDATVIKQESIVELAACAGKSVEVAEITERAMRGELDFKAALEERVKVLAGLPAEETFEKVETRVTLQPGIQAFVAFCREVGVPCFLVSGGFVAIAGPVARKVGFAAFRSNELGVEGGRLTGRVEGAVIDGEAKRAFVLETCDRLGCDPKETAAVGDGANDRLMLDTVGVAVGFEPKEVLFPHLAAVTDNHAFLGPLLFGRDVSITRARLARP
jgi:phosphoserine phosphatase